MDPTAALHPIKVSGSAHMGNSRVLALPKTSYFTEHVFHCIGSGGLCPKPLGTADRAWALPNRIFALLTSLLFAHMAVLGRYGRFFYEAQSVGSYGIYTTDDNTKFYFDLGGDMQTSSHTVALRYFFLIRFLYSHSYSLGLYHLVQ